MAKDSFIKRFAEDNFIKHLAEKIGIPTNYFYFTSVASLISCVWVGLQTLESGDTWYGSAILFVLLFLLFKLCWVLFGWVVTLPALALKRGAEAGYRRTVAAYRTEDHDKLVLEVRELGLIPQEHPATFSKASDEWTTHLRKTRLRAVLVPLVGWLIFGLIYGLFGDDISRWLRARSEGEMAQDLVVWVPVALMIVFMMASVADDFLRDRATPVSHSLSQVLENFQNIEQPSWHAEKYSQQTLTVTTEARKFELHFRFEGRHGVILSVTQSGIPEGYTLNPVTPATVKAEKEDVDIGERRWDAPSILYQSEVDAHREAAGVWFPPEVRALLLPLLAKGCEVEGGTITVGPLKYEPTLIRNVLEATEMLTALIPRWEQIAAAHGWERITEALTRETSEAIRQKTLDDCEHLSDEAEREKVAQYWAEKGSGFSRIRAAMLTRKPSEQTRFLEFISKTSPELAVRAQALKKLIEHHAEAGIRALAEVVGEEDKALIHELAIHALPKRALAISTVYQPHVHKILEPLKISAQIAPGIALIATEFEINLPILTTWFEAALSDPVPEHLDIIKNARLILKERGSQPALTERLKTLLSELKPLVEARNSSLQGQVTLAQAADNQGQVAIVSEGEVSLSESTEQDSEAS